MRTRAGRVLDSALCLANNCVMQKPLDDGTARFSKLRHQSMHHYTEYMELEDMDGAAATIQDLAAEYGRWTTGPPETVPSIEP